MQPAIRFYDRDKSSVMKRDKFPNTQKFLRRAHALLSVEISSREWNIRRIGTSRPGSFVRRHVEVITMY